MRRTARRLRGSAAAEALLVEGQGRPWSQASGASGGYPGSSRDASYPWSTRGRRVVCATARRRDGDDCVMIAASVPGGRQDHRGACGPVLDCAVAVRA